MKNKIIDYAYKNGIKDLSLTTIAYALSSERKTIEYCMKQLVLNGTFTFRVVRLGIKKVPTKIFTFNK